METILPALQAEQVKDVSAPAEAEYVPAKASDEKYAHVDSNTSVYEKMGAGTRFSQ